MEVVVIAEPHARFEQWLRTQGEPASSSSGLQLFMKDGCANCHAIRGTKARAHVGPDLTHVASHTTLAAGTIPNDRAHLREWLRDPQELKPGAKMPQLPLPRGDLEALVSYLEGLK
jgi:cytochrome c oxidase subunit 2